MVQGRRTQVESKRLPLSAVETERAKNPRRPWWLEILEQSPREEAAAQKDLWTSVEIRISLCELRPDEGIAGKKGSEGELWGTADRFIVLTVAYTYGKAFQYAHVCGLLDVRYTSAKLSHQQLPPRPQFLLVSLIVWDATEIVPMALNLIQTT